MPAVEKMSWREWWRRALSGPDNMTPDIARILLLIIVLFSLSAETYHIYVKGDFNLLTFGGGIAAVLTGSGALFKFKEKSEPQGDEA